MKYTDQVVQQQIEAYLRQDMSDLERSGFERRMHEDPALHEEVKDQEALMMAVRNERMLHLKAGLQAVPVSLWSATLLEYTKIALISAGIGLASIGAYFLYRTSSGNTAVQEKNSRVQEFNSRRVKPEEQNLPVTGIQAPEPAVPLNPVSLSDKSPDVVSSDGLQETRPARQLNGVQEKVSQLEAELPEPVLSQSQPQTPQNVNLPDDRLNNKTHPSSMQPEVVLKRDNREKFHYQFSDGKLVLYADFNEKLYEVLELNQHGQRSLFLSYDGKFYALDPQVNEITPLKDVKDKNLIQILTEYHKRK